MLDKKIKESLEMLGGRAILAEGADVYVMMTLKEFRKMRTEGMQGLTKQELVDRINNDIVSWKFSQEQKKNDEIELEEIRDIEDMEVRYEKAD